MNTQNTKKDILSKTAHNLGFEDFTTATEFAGQSDDAINNLEPDQRQFMRLFKQWIRKFRQFEETIRKPERLIEQQNGTESCRRVETLDKTH